MVSFPSACKKGLVSNQQEKDAGTQNNDVKHGKSLVKSNKLDRKHIWGYGSTLWGVI